MHSFLEWHQTSRRSLLLTNRFRVLLFAILVNVNQPSARQYKYFYIPKTARWGHVCAKSQSDLSTNNFGSPFHIWKFHENVITSPPHLWMTHLTEITKKVLKRFFADNISSLCAIKGSKFSVINLNIDLDKVSNLTFQCNVSFNSDPLKQADIWYLIQNKIFKNN